MEVLSLAHEALLLAFNKGYRVRNNCLLNEKKIPIGFLEKGYLCFTVKIKRSQNTFCVRVPAHRLAAFEKFGNRIFEADILVRHLDGNPLNNYLDNLGLGTALDNSMDRKPQDRLDHAIKTASHRRIFTDQEIERIREDSTQHGLSYTQIMKKWGIKNKGMVSYIMNHEYVTNCKN